MSKSYYKNEEELYEAVNTKFSQTISRFLEVFKDFGGIYLRNDNYSHYLRLVTCERCKSDEYKTTLVNLNESPLSFWSARREETKIPYDGSAMDILLYDLVNDENTVAVIGDHDVYMSRAFLFVDNKKLVEEVTLKYLNEKAESIAKQIEELDQKKQKLLKTNEVCRQDISTLKRYIKEQGSVARILRDEFQSVKRVLSVVENAPEDVVRQQSWLSDGITDKVTHILKSYGIDEEEEDDDY